MNSYYNPINLQKYYTKYLINIKLNNKKMIILYHLLSLIKKMFDIKFYKMLKYFIDFHNDINDYNKYKILKNKGELETLLYETLHKFNIGFKEYADI